MYILVCRGRRIASRSAQRSSYSRDRVISEFLGRRWSSRHVLANEGLGQFSTEMLLRRHLLNGEDEEENQRKGTQVLYIRPTPPKPRRIGKTEFTWSFDTPQGRGEYEAALNKHLKDKKVVSGDVAYEPLSSTIDIAKLANKKFANLVLIVHGAEDGPAIGVDLGKPDWIKADKFADMIAPFEYKKITIVGCDSVSNKFTPNLAKLLPKGSTVLGHKGSNVAITKHFEAQGRLKLTHVKSNLQLKEFKTEGGSSNRPSRPSHWPRIGP